MKTTYKRYGRETESLGKNLSKTDHELLSGYIKYCSMTAGASRLEKTKCYMLQFRDILEKPYDTVTKEDAIEFWGLVKASLYQEHTKIGIKRIVKRFLKWHFHDYDMIEPLKISEHLFNDQKVNKSTLLTESELKMMMHRAERIRDKALLILLYETAGRPQEIRELTWGDIDWDGSSVHLYSRKTSKSRSIPIKEALKHLTRWKQEWVYPDPMDQDYIFPSTFGSRYERHKPISVSYVNRIIKSIAAKAGIKRNIYTYLLRHTRLTEIRKLGIQGIEFNKFAGHKPGSTKREVVYIHLDDSDMKKTVLEKVYNVSALTQDQTDKYKERIDALEKQLREVIAYLKESRGVLESQRKFLEREPISR